MKSRLVLARYIEANISELVEHLIKDSKMIEDTVLRNLIQTWLQYNVAILNGKSCPMAEWATQFVERNRSLAIMTGDAYLTLKGFQKALTEQCVGQVKGVTDAEILSIVYDNSSCLEQAVVEYFALRTRQDRHMNFRRQKAILESVDMAMVLVDNSAVIEMVNHGFARLINSDADILQNTDFLSLCDEATASKLRSFLKNKRTDLTRASFPGAITFGNREIGVEITGHPFFDSEGRRAGAVLFLDTEEKKESPSQRGIEYVEKNLLPMIPLPLQLFDQNGNISFNSKQTSLLTPMGYDFQEPLCCFLHGRDAGKSGNCRCKDVFESGLFQFIDISVMMTSETKWYMVVLIPLLDESGNITHVINVVYDRSHRRQMQKQLENQIVSQQRSSLVAQISTTVAHQLRNPLSVVLGFAEMMSKGLPPDQYAEAVNRILRNSLRCKETVDNLLDFARGMPLERRPVDFQTLIRESVQPMLTPSQSRLISWQFPDKPALIECVPEQIAQIVLSLLENALHVARHQVLCSLEIKNELVRLRVVDDGPGIPIEKREQVFEPFYSTRREQGGIGLGLSLARAVVSDYGGSLSVCTAGMKEPKGACFVLQLPVMKEIPKEIEPSIPMQTKVLEKSILIVDDEIDLQDLLQTFLYMHGFRADTASTGMEALEKLKINEYDAILLDYLIPGSLDGKQTYLEIAERYPHLIPRILFITADMLNYQSRLFMESTGRPILEKPFLLVDFIMELDKMVDENK
ncbi:MAG: response regulator [Candidatus Hydrogenedentes bacterium]|nr:response regulator [Candidatus Hydrogenedentota bacterium]